MKISTEVHSNIFVTTLLRYMQTRINNVLATLSPAICYLVLRCKLYRYSKQHTLSIFRDEELAKQEKKTRQLSSVPHNHRQISHP
jgi:hypothetical protein